MELKEIAEEIEFLKDEPRVKLLFDSEHLRSVLFCLEQGQEILPHEASSIVSLYVVEGEGEFSSGKKKEPFKKNTLCTFEPNEAHGFLAKKRSVVIANIAPRP